MERKAYLKRELELCNKIHKYKGKRICSVKSYKEMYDELELISKADVSDFIKPDQYK